MRLLRFWEEAGVTAGFNTSAAHAGGSAKEILRAGLSVCKAYARLFGTFRQLLLRLLAPAQPQVNRHQCQRYGELQNRGLDTSPILPVGRGHDPFFEEISNDCCDRSSGIFRRAFFDRSSQFPDTKLVRTQTIIFNRITGTCSNRNSEGGIGLIASLVMPASRSLAPAPCISRRKLT